MGALYCTAIREQQPAGEQAGTLEAPENIEEDQCSKKREIMRDIYHETLRDLERLSVDQLERFRTDVAAFKAEWLTSHAGTEGGVQ